MSFAQARVEELPKWLRGPQATAYVTALGAAQDVELADLKFAVKQRFPTTCLDAALDQVGSQFLIDRFAAVESLATYRARVRAAWPTWRKAGTAPAILDSLHAFGIADAVIYVDDGA